MLPEYITWNAKCPIFEATLPLKPATIALKLGHLAFQVIILPSFPMAIPFLP